MRVPFPGPGALVLLGLGASLAAADPGYSPVFKTPHPCAPDACGPGFYYTCPYGTTYGPNYCVRPCWEPFQPCLPRFGPPGGPAGGAPQHAVVLPNMPPERAAALGLPPQVMGPAQMGPPGAGAPPGMPPGIPPGLPPMTPALAAALGLPPTAVGLPCVPQAMAPALGIPVVPGVYALPPQRPTAIFPSHAYARGPRDYFMAD